MTLFPFTKHIAYLSLPCLYYCSHEETEVPYQDTCRVTDTPGVLGCSHILYKQCNSSEKAPGCLQSHLCSSLLKEQSVLSGEYNSKNGPRAENVKCFLLHGKAIRQYFFPCAGLSQQQHQNLVPPFVKGEKNPFPALTILNTLCIKSILKRHILSPNMHIYKDAAQHPPRVRINH